MAALVFTACTLTRQHPSSLDASFKTIFLQRKLQNYGGKTRLKSHKIKRGRTDREQIAKLSSFPSLTSSISPSRPAGWRRQSKNSSRWIVRSSVMALLQATKHTVGWVKFFLVGERGSWGWRSWDAWFSHASIWCTPSPYSSHSLCPVHVCMNKMRHLLVHTKHAFAYLSRICWRMTHLSASVFFFLSLQTVSLSI